MPSDGRHAFTVLNGLKESLLNQEPQLEVEELGGAKDETKGLPMGHLPEENPVASWRQPL